MAGESEFSFDTIGGTQHITQSLQTVGKFAGSPNRANITVGEITGISKKGWEYLPVRRSLWRSRMGPLRRREGRHGQADR